MIMMKRFYLLMLLYSFAHLLAAQEQDDIPDWVTENHDSDEARNFVGIRTNALTLEQARDGAVADALDKLTQEIYGGKVTSDVKQFRGEVDGKLTDQFSQNNSFISKNRNVSGIYIAKWEWSKNKTGSFNAFVLIAYPKLAIAKSIKKQEQSKLDAEANYQSEIESVKRYVSQGLIQKAFQACLNAYGFAEDLTEVERKEPVNKAMEIAQSVTLTKTNEGNIQIQFDGKPLAKAQLVGANASSQIQIVRADLNGTIAPESLQGIRELRLDTDWFLGLNTKLEQDAFASVIKQLETVKLQFKNKITGARVLVLIQESSYDGLAERSVMATLIGKKLVQGGFKYITDLQIGVDNVELIDNAISRGSIMNLKSSVKGLADLVIHGNVKTTFSSDTEGIKCWIAEGTVIVTRLSDGVTLATDNDENARGYGDTDEKAAKDSLSKLSTRIAESLLSQMSNNE